MKRIPTTVVAACLLALASIRPAGASDPLGDLAARYATASPDEAARIQQAAWAMFDADGSTRRALYAAEKLLLDKYVHAESPAYAGNGTVEFVYADLSTKQIAVILDSKPADSAGGASARRGVLRDMQRLAGNIPLRVEYGTEEKLSCQSRKDACRPALGGVSIAQAGQEDWDASTIGYSAEDADGRPGFVIAGHAAGSVGISVVQPGGTGPVIGVVERYCAGPKLCDFAFVRANENIPVAAEIYADDGPPYPIRGRIPKTQQRLGTIVMKSGLATGVTYGILYANSPNDPRMLIKDIQSGHGDSGSPVFAKRTDGGADLYGMLYANSGGTIAFYYSWDTIRDSLSLSKQNPSPRRKPE